MAHPFPDRAQLLAAVERASGVGWEFKSDRIPGDNRTELLRRTLTIKPTGASLTWLEKDAPGFADDLFAALVDVTLAATYAVLRKQQHRLAAASHDEPTLLEQVKTSIRKHRKLKTKGLRAAVIDDTKCSKATFYRALGPRPKK